ncbi:DUF1993 family protein [uncultured Roseibium sp.]|uniref:DUF1993 family protein n=1 Tax=uncultured Roseibium sp. TaxID=1936171 RepID=UPI0026087EF1|nr:DUF1993 family protein [uncultured Roseibium sp.]
MSEDNGPGEALVAAIGHYLEQSGKLLNLVSEQPNSDELLAVQLAPDAFDTGFHLAVAIQFAARALCLPTGDPVPEIVEPCSLQSLRSLHEDVLSAINRVPAIDWDSNVTHTAGEAELTQRATDYVACFAFPNMLFHFTQAYAGLRHAGLKIGKADFDGLHMY